MKVLIVFAALLASAVALQKDGVDCFSALTLEVRLTLDPLLQSIAKDVQADILVEQQAIVLFSTTKEYTNYYNSLLQALITGNIRNIAVMTARIHQVNVLGGLKLDRFLNAVMVDTELSDENKTSFHTHVTQLRTLMKDYSNVRVNECVAAYYKGMTPDTE